MEFTVSNHWPRRSLPRKWLIIGIPTNSPRRCARSTRPLSKPIGACATSLSKPSDNFLRLRNAEVSVWWSRKSPALLGNCSGWLGDCLFEDMASLMCTRWQGTFTTIVPILNCINLRLLSRAGLARSTKATMTSHGERRCPTPHFRKIRIPSRRSTSKPAVVHGDTRKDATT